MVALNNILAALEPVEITGNTGVNIRQVVFDSRIAGRDDLFIAVKGVKLDGHDFIGEVIARGAAAIVCEHIPSEWEKKCTFIRVSSSSRALGLAASAFYGFPSSKMKLVGVTGTNGKTTTATLLYRLFSALGYRCGLFSTVANYVTDRQTGATHTTPDAVQMNALMNEMVKAGCTHCFMEVSSHAVDQHRIAGLKYAGAIFTNLTHDHLDYHKTFDNYLKAKKQYFDQLLPGSFAVVNKDDKNGLVMVQNTSARVITYGLRSVADYTAKIVESHIDGMLLKVNGKEVWSQLKGEFNASNFLAVLASAVALGEEEENVLRAMSELREVRGRFETLRSGNGVTAIIDYAHTPDALENILNAILRLRKAGERIITVMGAGGDRDKTKRPAMGRIAASMSDKLIITSDNPRSEEPEAIIRDVFAGVDKTDQPKVITLVSREEAIRTACFMAQPGDMILVAGKGHETYQDIKGVKHHFDDREVVTKEFEKMNR